MTVNNHIQTGAEHRKGNRQAAELKAIVQVKESEHESWKEVTNVSTVSRNGAGFSLTRPCVVGRLVTIVLPLDPELRAYDKKEEVYPVMSIIQYCNASTIDGKTVYHVGVGFVGKKLPESYKADPTQSYRVSGMKKDGLWEITEAESQFKKRKQPRYWISVPIMISLLQRGDSSGAKQRTITKNICAGGVSVVCTLDAKIGDKVKFACEDLDFYSMAMVRNRKMNKDGVTLHLEFIDKEFPIEQVIAMRVPEVAAA